MFPELLANSRDVMAAVLDHRVAKARMYAVVPLFSDTAVALIDLFVEPR
jgi:hypothetical protein